MLEYTLTIYMEKTLVDMSLCTELKQKFKLKRRKQLVSMAGLELLWEVEGYDLGFDQHQVQQEQRLLAHTQIGVTRQFVLLGRPGMS